MTDHLVSGPVYRQAPSGSEEFERGAAAIRSKQAREALQHFRDAESAGFPPDECASGRWHAWMLLGEFERAWQESDGILARGGEDPNRLWDSLPFEGKRLMIRCLHGLGDAIQFIRYAKLLRGKASRIIVESHAALVPLFSRLPYVDRAVTWEDGSSQECTDWDQQIEVMELPRALRTVMDSIPADVPYLSVGVDEIARSRQALGEKHGKPRVGLVWASSEWNAARSIDAELLHPILRLPPIELFSFQRGPRAQDLPIFRSYCSVHDTADHSPGLLNTAADLINMDLLITVDTMAAHLAGALATEVWTLLPFDSDWRWMLDGDASPWYPTMKLFRQSVPGDWSLVIANVADSLTRRCRVMA